MRGDTALSLKSAALPSQARPSAPNAMREPGGFKETAFRLSAGVIKWLERRFSTTLGLFRWYGERFYRQVLEDELDLTRLAQGARVLHIGAGALPYTAWYLAERGYLVDAIDHDPQTPSCAQKLLAETGVADRVRVMAQDGLRVDATDYAAIWISLHVCHKEEILARLIRTAKPGCWIIYREPRNWLNLFYRGVHRSFGPSGQPEGSCTHRLGKQSIAIRATKGA